MDTKLQFSDEDISYIEANFVCLPARPPHGPGPSYVLEDGREFYPAEYFKQEADEARFKARLMSEMRVQRATWLDPDETWQTYMDGIYGVCLRSATPENIVRKNALLQHIEEIVAAPRENDPSWVADLKTAVDALDALERPFSPHYDRARFGRPPTRDTHIRDVRERFLSSCGI